MDPPAWVIAFGIAAVIYVSISWFGDRHLSPGAKETLSLWLWGEFRSTWVQQFCVLFDTVFGERHLSWRCFVRSSLFSVLAVIFVLNLLGSRIFSDTNAHPIVQAAILVFGILLNTIVDYFSLLETRFVLRSFRKVSTLSGQLLMLVVDMALTAAIALFFFALVAYVAGRTLTVGGIIAIVAGLDPYSLVFYSTFFTSVWSWLFVLSTGIVRILSKRSVESLVDVEGNPHRQLALVSASLIFLPLVAFFLLTSSSNRFDFVDELLCTEFPQEICMRVANQSATEKQKRSLWQRGCAGGSGYSCLQLGRSIATKPEPEYKLSDRYFFFEKSCDLEVADACYYVGIAHLVSNEPGFEPVLATPYLLKACHKGIQTQADACYKLASTVLSSNKNVDQSQVLKWLETSCTAVRGQGCSTLVT